jgi:hypothetical protein
MRLFAFAGSIVDRMAGASAHFTLAKVYYPAIGIPANDYLSGGEREPSFPRGEGFRVTNKSL